MLSLPLQSVVNNSVLGLPFKLSGRSVTQRAIAILRRFGPDAHVYLPGVGMLNGLQAGNYIYSAGTTVGTVGQPVGLVLDAAGGLGVELAPVNSSSFLSATPTRADVTYPTATSVRVTNDSSNGSATGFGTTCFPATINAGSTYRVKFVLAVGSMGASVSTATNPNSSGVTYYGAYSAGIVDFIFLATASGTHVNLSANTATSGDYIEADDISVREVTGVHAQQPTTSAKPILRRGAVNLLTYSGDFSNAAWVKGNVNPGSIVTGPTGLQNARQMQFIYSSPITRLYQDIGVTSANGTKYTFAVWLRSAVNVNINVGVERSGPADGESVVAQITPSWQLVTFSHSGVFSGASAVRAVVFSYDVAFNASLEVGPLALFQGTYTAAQIQALGGIPATLTAPVSTALGAYWWDTSGSKSLVATFPAGNESVTVINATPTGQVTTTAQNVVGAYSINTNTNGRIIVNGALTASELALLQRFANSLAGL